MRRWVAAGLLVLVIALGMVVNQVHERTTPEGSTSVAGAIGEDIAVDPWQVHVNSARAAASVVEADSDDPPIGSDGVWVVVNLSYATTDEVRIAGGAGLVVRDGHGREYPISTRSPESAWLAGADIWVRGELAFEVASDSLEDLVLVFDAQSQGFGPLPIRYAVIPLELDPTAVLDETEVVEDVVLAEGDR